MTTNLVAVLVSETLLTFVGGASQKNLWLQTSLQMSLGPHPPGLVTGPLLVRRSSASHSPPTRPGPGSLSELKVAFHEPHFSKGASQPHERDM